MEFVPQAARANELAAQQGLAERVSFQAASPSVTLIQISKVFQLCYYMIQCITMSEPHRFQRINFVTMRSCTACTNAFHPKSQILVFDLIQVADALHQPFADNKFDLVWSLESGEHMPDKRRCWMSLNVSVPPQ